MVWPDVVWRGLLVVAVVVVAVTVVVVVVGGWVGGWEAILLKSPFGCSDLRILCVADMQSWASCCTLPSGC